MILGPVRGVLRQARRGGDAGYRSPDTGFTAHWRISSAVEQRNHNPLVGGSNPSFATTSIALSPAAPVSCHLVFRHLAAAFRRAALLALLAILAGAGLASARDLPADAKFGKLTAFQYPYALIGGKKLRMNAAARIYNEDNLIVQPAAMRQSAKVLYQLDSAGDLAKIWLLTEPEAVAAAQARGMQAGSGFTVKSAKSAPAAAPTAGQAKSATGSFTRP